MATGTAPPDDAPSPAQQDVVAADATFGPSPSGEALCGFALPSFSFSFSLNIPFPDFALPFPFGFALALNCDLSDPIDAEVVFGGGRVSTGDLSNEDRDY